MKPKNLKEIIDSISGVLTGFLSTVLLYVLKDTLWVQKYKEAIPLAVGVIILLLSLLLIFMNKRSIDNKEKQKTAEYKTELKEKIEFYSQIIKEEKNDSAYKKAAMENLTQLLKKDMDLIEEIEMERVSLKRDSDESDSLIMSYIKKVKESATKQGS
ncbi:hypothetical protein ABIX96_004931 [Escherichia coli]|uniref:hypothetical protein n=1 Tax=Escherichia coli TaxID=562 RepID=UPI000BB64C94|nr:hypothetical protein [Escherichia coli]EEX1775528.1 hypothetical protein [Escherichia coli]EEY3952399.1 hypothetical protein [Escherichia coli]EEY4004790.1 hypothetical protein [Escherichia coli]EFA4995926.1 hypothetical protein [Escherichia coli]EFA5005396.1 hypothetical protein [Escherichia coli]